MRCSRSLLLALGLAALPLAGAAAQQQPATKEAHPPLEVGTVAPDFSLPGATRYGVLKEPIQLSDFKGRTVVLSFFIKARTKG